MTDSKGTGKQAEEKPTLFLVPGEPTIEDLVSLCRQLTGKEPTEEDIEQARQILAEGAAEPGSGVDHE